MRSRIVTDMENSTNRDETPHGASAGSSPEHGSRTRSRVPDAGAVTPGEKGRDHE